MSKRRRTHSGLEGGSTRNVAAYTVPTEMRCFECRTKTTLFRHPKDKKPKGHKKHMYCMQCKRLTQHEQV